MEACELYNNYKSFVAKRAFSAVKKYGITNQFEDAFQEASAVFVMVANKFDPNKGTIVNIAWTAINRHLNKWAKKQVRQSSFFAVADDSWSVADENIDIPFEDESYKLAELKLMLTHEEEVLVSLALSHMFKDKSAIVCEMKKRGWSRNKTLKHCSSIREKIKAIA